MKETHSVSYVCRAALGMLLFLTIGITACTPIQELADLTNPDLRAPELLGTESADPLTIIAHFSEKTIIAPEELMCAPPLALSDAVSVENDVHLRLAAPTVCGTAYQIDAVARDEAGNSTSFITTVYGYNSEIPDVVINEFIPQGSSTHPDLAELYVRTAGNLGGLCLYEGASGNWEQRMVFPALQVEGDSYVLVHFKPEGITEEIDEDSETGIDASGGMDASPTARDFWVPGGTGLSGNNGALSLYRTPAGKLLDAVLYSNRTSDSDETYRGFGTRETLERVDELAAAGGWEIAGTLITPEECVNPEDSTSTRSICRGAASQDSNSAADWHITPTRGATFGAVNTDDVYVP